MNENNKYSNESKKKIIERNDNVLKNIRKSWELDTYSILKDDITNYKKLNEYQLLYIENLTEKQKIEIIKLYDKMFNYIKDII